MKYESPVGDLIIGSYRDKLCLCDWVGRVHRDMIDQRIGRILGAVYEDETSGVCRTAIEQLWEYFAGKRREFTLPIRFAGTEFQCHVWSELLKIPYGMTVSYAAIAQRIGNPKAVRAVSSAIATNPISIFVPCHRVIGSDNSLTGYAGGLAAKQTLLNIEAAAGLLF